MKVSKIDVSFVPGDLQHGWEACKRQFQVYDMRIPRKLALKAEGREK